MFSTLGTTIFFILFPLPFFFDAPSSLTQVPLLALFVLPDRWNTAIAWSWG